MKLATLTLALTATVYASQHHHPLNPEGGLSKRLDTLDKRGNSNFVRDASITKRQTGLVRRASSDQNTTFPDAGTDDPKNLSKPGSVHFVLCKDKDFGGECLDDWAEFLLYIPLEEQAPHYAGQVSSLWVEDGGLCWFYKSRDCSNDEESFGRMGGEEKDLANMEFDGEKKNFDDYFHCFFCQEGQPE
ncbi:hypothetical protein NX059_002701 [Plenodomus lindquistii]|nr:hypothetical protein NX059_002701 [Plenodomus lindquistii]